MSTTEVVHLVGEHPAGDIELRVPEAGQVATRLVAAGGVSRRPARPDG